LTGSILNVTRDRVIEVKFGSDEIHALAKFYPPAM